MGEKRWERGGEAFALHDGRHCDGQIRGVKALLLCLSPTPLSLSNVLAQHAIRTRGSDVGLSICGDGRRTVPPHDVELGEEARAFDSQESSVSGPAPGTCTCKYSFNQSII